MLGNVIDGQTILSEYGHVVKREIENISAIRGECIVENSVVMPNHIHLIVRIAIVGDDGNRPVDYRPADPRADCRPTGGLPSAPTLIWFRALKARLPGKSVFHYGNALFMIILFVTKTISLASGNILKRILLDGTKIAAIQSKRFLPVNSFTLY